MRRCRRMRISQCPSCAINRNQPSVMVSAILLLVFLLDLNDDLVALLLDADSSARLIRLEADPGLQLVKDGKKVHRISS